ncbi:TonB-dependent receptor [Niabella beijingensis]|uniref:TonB-dependent receptor n=1 Tax=Niabella beijingensis TaxID=2872700 RepID=UPI001CBB9A2C|nr:TonB-dependent receptor [Niabella beijingensis]MBZ4189436.1 TonB-dependent receptor [Niabella beijingensis]
MKLTTVLLIITFMEVSAASHGQHLTISNRNISLSRVISEIRTQTGYGVLISTTRFKTDQKLNLNFRNAPLREVLNKITGEMGLTYTIEDRTIVIRPRPLQDAGVIPVAAAPIVISGKVTDESGQPLQGVTVTVRSSGSSVVTDARGAYRVQVADKNDLLTFSYVGYITVDAQVNKGGEINMTLRPQKNELDEIVVIGYGTATKRDLTGASARVRSEEINAIPAANVLQALSGRASGVQVLQNNGSPGGGVSVRIRGANSIQGSNEPLYVVDGFPVSGNNPTVINNTDIESIDILKDASATAIYGSRGANGVVLITTKRGKAGRTRIDFESSYSIQSLRKKLDLMNAKEYALFYNEQAANDKLDPYFTQEQIDGFGEGYDWQGLVFTKAPMTQNSLTVSGGNDKTQFSLSGSVFSQDGIIKGSDYKRYSLHTNLQHTISEKFNVTFSGTFSRLKTGRKDSEAGVRGASMIASSISAPPTLTPYKEEGTYTVLAGAYPFVAPDMVNPLNFINEQSKITKANVVLANAAINYHPVKDLTIKVLGGIENRDDRTDTYTSTNFVNSLGVADVSTSQFTSLLNENTITYDKRINDHHITALAGLTYQDFLTTSLSARGTGFLSDISGTNDLGSAGAPGVPQSNYAKSVLLSALARVNYNYGSKYLATVSFRRDGSSRYSTGNKWGSFPSAALAWRISQEPFMKTVGFISDLKLRASWGYTGSQAISPYATLSLLYSGKTVFGDGLATTYAPDVTLPGDLKWETTEQKDIGFDIGLFENRLIITADYYIKNTRDLLNSVKLPSSMGFTSTIQNVGKIRNNGFELGIDAQVLTGAFKWNLAPNISFNRNKVVKLYGGEDILGHNIGLLIVNDYSNILREGRPVGQFWGYVEEGYTDQGQIRFKDLNGDGAITADDKTYIGDPNPDFTYGLNSAFSYKNLSLTLFLQGSKGNDIFNTSAIGNTMDYGYGVNMPKEVYYNHWTPDNPNAKYPRISYNTGVRVSDRFVEDGSYMRLKNIELGYSLPVQQWHLSWLQRLQAYVSGQNLLTFTKYSWWDPEVNSQGSIGYDFHTYPVARSITFGIRAGF